MRAQECEMFGLCLLPVGLGRRPESRAIGSDETRHIVESAFSRDFADSFFGCLHEHARVLQAMLQDPFARGLTSLL